MKTDLSHRLCPCDPLCRRSCSSPSSHSCTNHGFHKAAARRGSPLGGDREQIQCTPLGGDREQIQRAPLGGDRDRPHCSMEQARSPESEEPSILTILTCLAAVALETLFTHTQGGLTVSATHPSVQTGGGVTAVLLCRTTTQRHPQTPAGLTGAVTLCWQCVMGEKPAVITQ